jgi:hypothetical protein
LAWAESHVVTSGRARKRRREESARPKIDLAATPSRRVLEAPSAQQAHRHHTLPRRGSNWPKLPEQIGEKSLRADINMLREEHQKLRDAIANLPEAQLTPKQIWRIHGVAAHDVYHAGQIKLLRRLIASR